MLTPFSLRSRHSDVTTLSSFTRGQHQQLDQVPRRRSGSDRHLPASVPPVVDVHGHRASDGSPRISLQAPTTEPNSSDRYAQIAVTDDVTDSRTQGMMTSSPRVSQSITETSTDASSSSTTITTKSSEDLNWRLAASLTRWNAQHINDDDIKTITTKNSSDLNDQMRQIAVTGDVTNARVQGVITSLPATSTGDVTDSRAPGLMTSSHQVGQSTVDNSTTVQASGTRSTPAVQPSTASTRTVQSDRQAHSASMSDMMNVESKTSDERTTSRPRSTIYGEIRDRVFGSKQQTVSGSKLTSPFSKFEPLRDESGHKSSTDFTGLQRSKHADGVVEDTAGHVATKRSLTAGVIETNQSHATAPADPRFSSSRPQANDHFPKLETTTALAATSQVSSASHVSSTISPESRSDVVIDNKSSQQSVTQERQQTRAATTDMRPQGGQTSTQVNTPVGRSLTTRAEVRPWTQSHPGMSSQRKLDSDMPTKADTLAVQQIGGVLPSNTTAGQRSTTDHSVLPAVSTSSVQTSRGKVIPSSASRVDWAKQRFGASQSADVIPDSSPKLKHRTIGIPQPEPTYIAEERVLSNLDESISKLAAAAATRVVSSSSSVQNQSSSPQTADSSAVVTSSSTAVHSPPFKPLTVSPPVTVSSRVAIVHGLQMSPPASTTAASTTVPRTTVPRTATEPNRSVWSPAVAIQQSAAGKHLSSLTADVRFATKTESGSGFQSTTSSATSTSDGPFQRAVGESVSQRPSHTVVSSTTPALQSHVPPTAAPGVTSMPSVSRPHLVSTAPVTTSLPPQLQMSTPMFSIEKPVVSPVVARPAQPTITARVWKPEVPQIRLTAQPLKPVMVMQSPVPESKLILVAPTTSTVSQKSIPDTTSARSLEDTGALYLTATRHDSRSAQTETSKISSQPSHVSVSQSSAHRTQVEVTQNQVQSGQIGVQQVQTPIQTQPSQIGASQIQASKPAMQPSNVAFLQIQQPTASAQPRDMSRVEARRQVQPNRVEVAETERKSTGIASGSTAVPATRATAQRSSASQAAEDSRTRQNERQAAAGRQQIASSPTTVRRNQVDQHRGSATQVFDRQWTVIPPGLAGLGESQRRGGTAVVDDEVDRALRVLDSIAAETRSLSTSLSRTTTLLTSTTSTPLRVQTSQASTAVVVGSQRDVAPVPDQKPRQQKFPRAQTTPLQSAKSLDSSGVIKKHLVHLESIFRPGVSDLHLKKSVQLRRPKPLRKAQTVDLTTVGIGVDPELMQLLQTRKEKSASDDEDSAAKSRDDIVSTTSRYATGDDVLRC